MICQTISHYKVIEKIGQGGMGEVHRPQHTSLKRERVTDTHPWVG